MGNWSGYAKTAFGCVVVWALLLSWMWLDFQYGSHVWRIGGAEALVAVVIFTSVPLFLFCVIAMLWRTLRGRSPN